MAPTITLEMAPGHQTPDTPDTLRGSANPLSLRKAFTTPPIAPATVINRAHTQGFIFKYLQLTIVRQFTVSVSAITQNHRNRSKPPKCATAREMHGGVRVAGSLAR